MLEFDGAMRAVFGPIELDAGVTRWRGAPSGASERAQFGYTPEERGWNPRKRVRDELVHFGEMTDDAGRILCDARRADRA